MRRSSLFFLPNGYKKGKMLVRIIILTLILTKHMTTRKTKDKNIRSLTRVGKSSLSVTIPLDIVQALGLRERQKVVVKRTGKKIVIEDWK